MNTEKYSKLKMMLQTNDRIENILGLSFIIRKNVFPSDIFPSTRIFGTWLISNLKNPQNMLEIGCGCGAIAIAIAKKYGCSVAASDISTSAVENCIENVKLHGLEHLVEVMLSNVFKDIPASHSNKYETIVWNTPFMYTSKNCGLAEFYDSEYNSLQKFFENVRLFLKKNGHAYLGFGSIGDFSLLVKIAQLYNFTLTIMGSFRVVESAGEFDYLVIQLGDNNDSITS